jgi:alkylation response protein AidB-like acyl-CoA dehydrogenase
MIDFELGEDQKMLVESIGRFAQGQVRKQSRDADEDGRIPADLIRSGWEFGLLQTGIAEEYGGLGEYSALTGCVAAEAFAHGDLSIALAIGLPAVVALPIMLAGTPAQKEEFVPGYCQTMPPAASAGLTEPGVLYDPRCLQTTAIRRDGEVVLNGVKSVVPLADEADLMLIYANEAGQTQAYLVPTDAPGLTIGPREKLMGIRALPTFQVRLADVRVPAANRLGGEAGADFELLLNHSRVALGAAAVGVARAAYEYAREYAKQRVQFGEPIAHRQAIAFMLAEMAMDVDAARLLVWETAWKLDRGEAVTREAAVMKAFVDDMVVRVADRALQALGGYGYIREYPAELWLRNARGFATFDGLAMV